MQEWPSTLETPYSLRGNVVITANANASFDEAREQMLGAMQALGIDARVSSPEQQEECYLDQTAEIYGYDLEKAYQVIAVNLACNPKRYNEHSLCIILRLSLREDHHSNLKDSSQDTIDLTAKSDTISKCW